MFTFGSDLERLGRVKSLTLTHPSPRMSLVGRTSQAVPERAAAELLLSVRAEAREASILGLPERLVAPGLTVRHELSGMVFFRPPRQRILQK